ncbi:hypothetical protein IT400_02090, partial [Candidatus Nomurabacteria bacterium]|nr:hypothetical protein [Candidatus Nomurabacteria bacterium]
LLFKSKNELDAIYKEKEGKYKELKELLISDIINYITPMREIRNKLSKSDVLKILEMGKNKMMPIVDKKMIQIRNKIGVQL